MILIQREILWTMGRLGSYELGRYKTTFTGLTFSCHGTTIIMPVTPCYNYSSVSDNYLSTMAKI